MTTEYTFIKYFPIAIARAKAKLAPRHDPRRVTSEFTYNESELLKSRSNKGGYEHRAALCVAMTSSRDNDTPVQPQSERDMRNSGAKPSQAMGAVA